MKKYVLLVAAMVVGTVSASAQFYAGGSLSLSTNSTDEKSATGETSSFGFSIAPEVGYVLSDKLEAGLYLSFGSESADAGGTTTTKTKDESSWGIAPYARYSVLSFNKFSVWGQAELYLNGRSDDLTKVTRTTFGLSVTPVLKYSLSDKIDLKTGLNFLSLGFSSQSTKYDGEDAGSQTTFGLSGNTANIVNLGSIYVGFEYKF